MTQVQLKKAVKEWLEAGHLKYQRRGMVEHPMNPDMRQEALAVCLMLELADAFGMKPRKPADYTGWTRDNLWVKFEKAEIPLKKGFKSVERL